MKPTEEQKKQFRAKHHKVLTELNRLADELVQEIQDREAMRESRTDREIFAEMFRTRLASGLDRADEVLAGAKKLVAEKQAQGWKQSDFSDALGRFFTDTNLAEMNEMRVIDAKQIADQPRVTDFTSVIFGLADASTMVAMNVSAFLVRVKLDSRWVTVGTHDTREEAEAAELALNQAMIEYRTKRNAWETKVNDEENAGICEKCGDPCNQSLLHLCENCVIEAASK